MRKLGPQHRVCRRIGAPLCGLPDCPALTRPYPPGQHGNRFVRTRRGEYEKRLLEKQKLRAIYGIPEGQMRHYYERAAGKSEARGNALLRLLETRLDAIVLRLGFARTIRQARVMVSQGHVEVDGRRLSIPSAAIRPGQRISLSPRARQIPSVREHIGEVTRPPAYLEQGPDGTEGRLARLPEREEIPLPVSVDDRLIVEHYA